MSYKDERKDKIRSLKAVIREKQEDLKQQVENLNSENSDMPTEDETKKMIESIAKTRSEISETVKELTLTRLNKNSSAFFEWHPHKGMNRRMAREFRRNRRKR